MKKTLLTELIILLVVFIIIQFFRPAKNKSDGITATDITKSFAMPADVQNILRTSCYDCHSNNTKYPWYAEIQPVSWWLSSHIIAGKKQVNFSEFGSYSIAIQYEKFKETIEDIQTVDMPLKSYLVTQHSAMLSEDKKAILINWTKGAMSQLEAKNPSLVQLFEEKK
jgi:hypothetical protein